MPTMMTKMRRDAHGSRSKAARIIGFVESTQLEVAASPNPELVKAGISIRGIRIPFETRYLATCDW
jgi:hypothetical protein